MDVLELTGKDYIINFLSKNPNVRTEEEIKRVSKYFSETYQYFIRLKSNKDFGFQRIEKITKFAKLEIYNENEAIINYGELGDKFYILLEGSVSLYKPIYYEEYLTPIEFSDLLIKIRDIQSDKNKYERLIEKNNHLQFNVKEIENMKGMKPNYMFYKIKMFLEKFEKVGEFGEGFSFGEMALIRKTTRNATIKANIKSFLLTLEKKDYIRAIKELQDKKLSKDIEKFIGSYPIFKMFYKDKILEVLNNFKKKTIYKGEYLFQQNDESDDIYFLKNGTINLNFNISFAWLNEYLIYINSYYGNLIFYLIDNKPKKYSDLIDIIQKARKEIDSIHYLNKPKDDEIKIEENSGNEKWEECNKKIYKGNLIGIKYEEEQLNNSNKLFYVNLKDVKPNEMIGLEDTIECRKRIFSAQCISEHAEFDCIRIIDLIKILCNLKEKDLYEFLNYILKKKDILKSQIINKLNYLEKNILLNLDNKYDLLKGDENNIKKEADKNRIISVIKMKGFKTKIQELLDKDLILPYYSRFPKTEKSREKKIKYNSTEKELMERNKKDLLILKKIYKLSFSNPHIFKAKKKKELYNIKNFKLNKLYSKKNNIYPYFFSKRNKPIIKKAPSFLSNSKNDFLNSGKKDYLNSGKKDYLNSGKKDYLNSGKKDYLNSGKKDYTFNSFLSSSKDKINSRDKNIFTKLLPKFNLNKNMAKEKKISLTNKILSIYTSPLKEPSSTFTDSNEINKNLLISFPENQNKNSHNNINLIKITKRNKNKLSNSNIFNKDKYNDEDYKIIINKTENINKLDYDDEKTFYEKLEKSTKEFILGGKFTKRLKSEMNKFKPWKYRTFYNK